MARSRSNDFLENWRSSHGSLTDKARMALRNTWIKARTGSSCCGNHGQPGC
ncbi:hypothetical protein [Egibacter rhizosphaerae]|uniref:hypothetical protein n=1 Tax=Egibacter rhizosphaerae TaxID=1670831 RepID=UPI0013F164D3|nr:hypothetical protein [Egibacter rhizosphaerae]